MSTYAIGDIQGCYLTFQKLLGKISFHSPSDQLWLVGDLVNRGPRSLEMLRWCVQNQNSLKVVLGNHDIHLLCRSQNISPEKSLDTLEAILQAPDRKELIYWLKKQAFVHNEGNYIMVHAGLLPYYTLAQLLQWNQEGQARLQGKAWKEFLQEFRYSKNPDALITTLQVITQLRMCTANGDPSFQFKGPLDKAPSDLIPWFRLAHRETHSYIVIFGHWASLGLVNEENIMALDTGCVWGRKLTAIRLEDRALFQQEMID